MDDRQIIDLYLQRNESALAETERKYGAYCFRIARNILDLPEDAQECVNDTWHTAWNRIPPAIPLSLRAFLGKLVRDLSLSRYRANHAQKRDCTLQVLLEELDECVPSSFDVEQKLEAQALADVLNRWLDQLSTEERALFLRRYYSGVSVKALAGQWGITEGQMAHRMWKLRRALRRALEKEGFIV